MDSAPVGSGPDLARAPAHVLVGAELGQTHGAACVHAVGRDAHLGAEQELAAVGEARAGVVIDAGAVDLGQVALGRRRVGGDDAVRDELRIETQ